MKCNRCGNVLLDYSPADGYVYILTNPKMPDLLKIGYTWRSIEERIGELNNASGVPAPFILEAYFTSECPVEDEQLLHNALEAFRIRGKEFFQITLKEAIFIGEQRLNRKVICVSEAAKEIEAVTGESCTQAQRVATRIDKLERLKRYYIEKGNTEEASKIASILSAKWGRQLSDTD